MKTTVLAFILGALFTLALLVGVGVALDAYEAAAVAPTHKAPTVVPTYKVPATTAAPWVCIVRVDDGKKEAYFLMEGLSFSQCKKVVDGFAPVPAFIVGNHPNIEPACVWENSKGEVLAIYVPDEQFAPILCSAVEDILTQGESL